MDFLYFLESVRNPVLDFIMTAITYLGSEVLFVVAAITVMWCVGKDDGFYLLTVGFFGIFINQFLKIICRVPRPWVRDPNFTIVESARADAGGYSFPSGHTQNITGIAGSLAVIFRRRTVTVIACVLTALTALSRMYLGVHTPADVLTSVAIGTLLVFGLMPLFTVIRRSEHGMYFVIGVILAAAIAYLLFLNLYDFPADTDPANLASSLSNGYMMLGAALGFAAAYPVEKKFVRYETACALPVQFIKTIVGFVIVIGLKELLKLPLNAIFTEYIARTIRYFIIVFVAVTVYPISFKYFNRINFGKKRPLNNQNV